MEHKIMKLLFINLLTLLTLYAFSSSAYAQSHAQTVKDLTQSSEVILIGKIAKLESKWNEDKSRIYTDVTIDVGEFLKGSGAAQQITIKQLGGEVGEVGELYSHVPKFESDEEVFLFMKKNKSEELVVNGGTEGKIRISEDESTGRRMVSGTKTLESLKLEVNKIISEK